MKSFYKNESDYDDAMLEAARNTCQNCGEVAADLRMVHESETPFKVCDTCHEEIEAIFEREAAGEPLPADRMVIASFRKPASSAAAPAPFTIVERWDGLKWIEVRLVWNGTQYAEVA